MSGRTVTLTPFELAVERSERVAELVYNEYDNLNIRKRNGRSFLLEYLSSGQVSVHSMDTLIRMGENINYEQNGENCFMKLLKEYNSHNLLPLVNYMLRHVNLAEQEGKLRERGFSVPNRCFPSLFDSSRNSFRKPAANSNNNNSNCAHPHQRMNSGCARTKGYNSIGIVLKYCSRKCDRMNLINMLLINGSSLKHETKKGRSLLHLTIKSNYSSLNEIKFLVSNGIPIQWTDIKQAIKYKKINYLHYLLINVDPKIINLKQFLPEAMSMLVLKSKPSDYSYHDGLGDDGYQFDLTFFLAILMNDHHLDPRPPTMSSTRSGSRKYQQQQQQRKGSYSVTFPVPLLFMLIFKNKLYPNFEGSNGNSFYGEAIKLIATDERIDLDYRYETFGTALTYATKLDQPPDIVSLLFPGANGYIPPPCSSPVDGGPEDGEDVQHDVVDGGSQRFGVVERWGPKKRKLGNSSNPFVGQVACYGDGYLSMGCVGDNVLSDGDNQQEEGEEEESTFSTTSGYLPMNIKGKSNTFPDED